MAEYIAALKRHKRLTLAVATALFITVMGPTFASADWQDEPICYCLIEGEGICHDWECDEAVAGICGIAWGYCVDTEEDEWCPLSRYQCYS